MTDNLMTIESATKILDKMRAVFGTKFQKQWANVTTQELVLAAQQVLAGLTRQEVERGFAEMITKTFCPSLPEFRAWCRPSAFLDISWDSPDVAWSKALESEDERLTIIWTDEASESFGIAKPALDANDKFTAGRAFKDHYAKLIEKAKLEQRMPNYWTSLGDDANHRLIAVQANSALLALDEKQEQLLVGYISEEKKPLPTDFAEKLAKLRDELGFNQETAEQRYAKQLAEQEAKKQRQIDALKDRVQQRHVDPFDDKEEYLESIKDEPTQQLNYGRIAK